MGDPKLKKLDIVTDSDGWEAIYINGCLHMQDGTVYACDIAEAAGQQACLITHHCLEADWAGDFPPMLTVALMGPRPRAAR